MRPVSANDFAVVIDTERNFVVHAGNASDMYEAAATMNRIYQSTAYRVEKWKP